MPFEPLKFLINQVKTAVGNLTSLKTPQPDVVTALNAHTDQIEELDRRLSTASNGSVTANNVAFTAETRISKYLKIVDVMIEFRPNMDISSWEIIGTISEGYRPTNAVFAEDVNQNIYLQINTNGTIQTGRPLTTGTLYRTVPIVYIV